MASTAAATLGALRIGVGLLTYFAPVQATQLFGVPLNTKDHKALLLSRLFAVRDFALGAGLLYFSREPTQILQLGLLADLVDVVSTAVAVSEGLELHGIIGVGAGAAFLAALGAFALSQ